MKSEKKKERKKETHMTTSTDTEKPFKAIRYLATIKPISKLEIEEYFHNLMGGKKQNKLQLTSYLRVKGWCFLSKMRNKVRISVRT